MVPSSHPATIYLPLGDQASVRTLSGCVEEIDTGRRSPALPVIASQNCTDRSPFVQAETSSRPSGDQATAATGPPWSIIVSLSEESSSRQRRNVPSRPAEARRLPSGE